MTIESSGTLGLNGTCTGGSSARNQIGAEVSKTAGTALCMNNSCLRTLSGTSSGTSISFSTFYGKSNSFTYTVSSNQTNFCMRAGAVSAGWNGSSKLNVTINSGVIISANSTGVFAMTIQGSYPNGVTVKNNGTIVGVGGNGGAGGAGSAGHPGTSAGPALKISSAVTICNASGVIAGGGGGGGGGAGTSFGTGCGNVYVGGGGGGGGRSSAVTNTSGGAGGCACASGSAGGTGTYSSAGGGGAGGSNTGRTAGAGGTGGSWGATGSTGGGGACGSGGGGGAGGKATCGASLVTWTATGTRYGSIN